MPDKFPVTVSCPSCRQNAMTLYEASSGDPWWCYCASCKTAGDIVNVARNRWKLDSTDTTPFQIEGLELPAGSTRVQNELMRFWEHCTDGTTYDPDLYRQCELTDAPQHARKRFLEQIGFASATQIKDFASRASYRCTPKLDRSEKRKFSVTRLFDLPGRVRGFMLRSHTGFHNLIPNEDFPGSLFGGPVVGDEVILCNSFPVVTSLYARAAREGITCPVVGMFRRPEPRLVAFSLPPKVICWCPDDPVRAIHMARLVGRKVSLTAPQSLPQYNLPYQLSLIKQQPLSWQEGMYRLIAKETDGTIARLLYDMDWSPAEKRLFVQEAPAYVQDAVRAHDAPVKVNSTKITNTVVVEMADGWYLKSGELVTDAPIRLDHVEHDTGGKAFYRGVVTFQGQTYDCRIPTAAAEKRLLSWIRAWLRDEMRVGVSRFHPDWDSKAIQAALAFHPPTVAKKRSLGWHQDDQTFYLPGYGLTARGDILGPGAHESPAGELPRPSRLMRDCVERLSQPARRTEVLWAALGALGANLLAPAIGKPRPGILLVGETAWEPLTELLTSLGCPTWGNLTDRSRVATWQLKEEWIGDHQWPGLIRTTWTRQWKRRLHEWTANDAESLICQVDPEAALGLMSRGSWLALCPDEPLGFSRELRSDAGHALVNWLEDVCRRRLCVAAIGDYRTAILEDMATWFENAGGNAAVIRAAATWLLASDQLAEFFVRLVQTRRKTGETQSAANPYFTAIVPGHDGVWIPELLVDRLATDSRMGLAIDKTTLERSLLEAKCGKRRELQQVSGWLIKDVVWSNIFLCGRCMRITPR